MFWHGAFKLIGDLLATLVRFLTLSFILNKKNENILCVCVTVHMYLSNFKLVPSPQTKIKDFC